VAHYPRRAFFLRREHRSSPPAGIARGCSSMPFFQVLMVAGSSPVLTRSLVASLRIRCSKTEAKSLRLPRAKRSACDGLHHGIERRPGSEYLLDATPLEHGHVLIRHDAAYDNGDAGLMAGELLQDFGNQREMRTRKRRNADHVDSPHECVSHDRLRGRKQLPKRYIATCIAKRRRDQLHAAIVTILP
jgi:hypothetical protein